MERVAKAIKSVFPDYNPSTLSVTTPLGDIPGWDSMNSVNLTLELETTFSIDLSNVILSDRDTVGDVVGILRERGAVLRQA